MESFICPGLDFCSDLSVCLSLCLCPSHPLYLSCPCLQLSSLEKIAVSLALLLLRVKVLLDSLDWLSALVLQRSKLCLGGRCSRLQVEQSCEIFDWLLFLRDHFILPLLFNELLRHLSQVVTGLPRVSFNHAFICADVKGHEI